MKICLVQYRNFHSELIGPILEIIKVNNKKLDMDFYFDYPDDKYSFVPFFKSIYSNISIFKTADLTSTDKKYDLYFLLSSDEYDTFKNANPKVPNSKIIVFTHISKFEIPNLLNVCLTKIVYKELTTPKILFNSVFNNTSILNEPIRRNEFLVTGNYHQKDIQDLNLLLETSKDNFIIHFVNKEKMKNDLKFENLFVKDPRLKLYYQIPTIELIYLVKKVGFMMTLFKKSSYYHTDRFSACLGLAISFNKPLFCDEQLKEIYNFDSCVTYKNSITETIENALNLKEQDYWNLSNNMKKIKEHQLEQNINNYLFKQNEF